MSTYVLKYLMLLFCAISAASFVLIASMDGMTDNDLKMAIAAYGSGFFVLSIFAGIRICHCEKMILQREENRRLWAIEHLHKQYNSPKDTMALELYQFMSSVPSSCYKAPFYLDDRFSTFFKQTKTFIDLKGEDRTELTRLRPTFPFDDRDDPNAFYPKLAAFCLLYTQAAKDKIATLAT